MKPVVVDIVQFRQAGNEKPDAVRLTILGEHADVLLSVQPALCLAVIVQRRIVFGPVLLNRDYTYKRVGPACNEYAGKAYSFEEGWRVVLRDRFSIIDEIV